MKSIVLENGIKLIYKPIEGDITSFCIGFNAGALEEEGYPLGIAHAVEHMVFKETKHRSEDEINRLCDQIFGFQNAMTNYPYVVYYGTSLSEDFQVGLDLFSDILINPTFPVNGFNEEIAIIKEELKEWKDDVYQSCEDELLYNAFNTRRIKNLIIGTEDSVSSITLDHIKSFYNEFYRPDNMVITVVTSLDYDEVIEIVSRLFKDFRKEDMGDIEKINHIKLYEENNPGLFSKVREDINGAKIMVTYPLHHLNDEEIKALEIFNHFFGVGTSSILYNNIRTKNALAYEVGSSIKNERGIKLFSIHLGTSKDKVDKAIEIINSSIEKVKNCSDLFTKDEIKNAFKSIKLKRELRLEKSIQLAKDLTCYQLMYGSYNKVYEEVESTNNIDSEFIYTVVHKVFNNPTIQILS
ncbi:insulinase family protein [Clostridium sp. MSJ-11]|uniref:Insulinase family protein n=1 Tax=Clostridium mobile TaxID=2841512 RepID=A0ABS6ED34_9CLOT|nr:pitrilysin family protein [Clostridium mobile]MBU5483108.1 insulinase family protein [Clostridium mobile]